MKLTWKKKENFWFYVEKILVILFYFGMHDIEIVNFGIEKFVLTKKFQTLIYLWNISFAKYLGNYTVFYEWDIICFSQIHGKHNSEIGFLNNISRICPVTPASGQKNSSDQSRCSNQKFLLSGSCTRKIHHDAKIETWRYRPLHVRMWTSFCRFYFVDASKLKRQWQVKETSHSYKKLNSR